MTEGLPTGPQRSRMPLALKILLGATIGCGTLLILLFVAGTAGMFWFLSPGEQVPTRAILGPETVGVLRLSDIAADEGAFQLLARSFLELDRAARRVRSRELPESMRWMEALRQANREQSIEGIKIYVPRDATVTLELSPGDDLPRVVAAANLRMFPRLIRGVVSWVAGSDPAVATTRHAGHEFQVFSNGGALAFHGGTLLWAQDEELMRRTLDRMTRQARATERGGSAPVGDPPGSWDVHAELEVTPETLAWLDGLGAGAEAGARGAGDRRDVARQLARLLVRIDVMSDDVVEGSVVLECTGAEHTARWGDELSRRFEDLRSDGAPYGIELDFQIGASGAEVRGDARATGLRDAIAAFAERFGQEIARESGG